LKRIMLVLTVALVMAATVLVNAGSVLAAPGNNGKGNEISQGTGQGRGDGDVVNPDSGNKVMNGGGRLNNPNLTGCDVGCTPF
jgi:hypothetical protein